jgi:serine protease Do
VAAPAQYAGPSPVAGTGLVQQQRRVFQHALRTVTPSVVRIDTIGGAQPVRRETDAQQRQRVTAGFRQADGPTTGVIWSSDGYILTSSFNFVRDPVVITVRLADGQRHVARLIARDRPARLALLKIDASGLPMPRWAAADRLRAGQWALTAGWGHGSAEPAVSVGILSALQRMDGQAVQTDAKISPVNYGGPLFDSAGRVIGICVPLGPGEDELAGVEWYDSGIGFAIHAAHLRLRVPRLMRGADLHRGLLGIGLDEREPVVGAAEQAALAGLRIVGTPRGPAGAVGLQEHDLITQIDGVPTPRIVDFRRAVARKAAGDTIRVDYRRGEQAASVTLELAAAADFRTVPTSQPK